MARPVRIFSSTVSVGKSDAPAGRRPGGATRRELSNRVRSVPSRWIDPLRQRRRPISDFSGGTKPLFESRETPPQHYLVAHSDGGARGNPGPAGYGVVIEDESGRTVATLSEYLGHQTNNFAEYQGLIAALEYALKHGPRRSS